ncbi:hypothetical protein HY227_00415 [Candidatus Wolfebacteria bacterium]|nr:hypothetical protein [Candidatus Wolfebacteria bacterium]
MSLITRRIIFYILVVLFFIIATAIILYSYGWTIDIAKCDIFTGKNFQNQLKELKNCSLKIQKTGAIYVETKPKDVLIKIDGKIYKDKSGLIQSGTLIDNLRPKIHKVEISKTGYLPWLKNLEVRPELVAEAQNIFLIPEKIEKELISIPRLRGNEIEAISGKGDKFIIKDSPSEIFYLYNFEDLKSIFNVNLNFKNIRGVPSIKKAVFHPFEPNKLIIETAKGLDIIDTLRLKTENITKNQPALWLIQNSNVFFIKQTAINKTPKTKTPTYGVYSFNLIIKNETLEAEIDNPALAPKNLLKFGVSPSGGKIAVLNNSGNLYIYNSAQQNWDKKGSNIENFAFSPDSKKIAFWDKDKKLNILFLEDWKSDIPKKEGDIIKLVLQNNPLKIEWYKNSYHLLITYPAELKIMEIDYRDPVNSYPLIQRNGNEFLYSPDSDFIYFIEEKNLYRIGLTK